MELQGGNSSGGGNHSRLVGARKQCVSSTHAAAMQRQATQASRKPCLLSQQLVAGTCSKYASNLLYGYTQNSMKPANGHAFGQMLGLHVPCPGPAPHVCSAHCCPRLNMDR